MDLGPRKPGKLEISSPVSFLATTQLRKPDFGWWTPFLRNINFGKKFLLYFNMSIFRGLKFCENLSPGILENLQKVSDP
jgi:hypothetical protein